MGRVRPADAGRSVRVGLDLTPVISGDTGVARYATELCRCLAADHPDVEVRSFGAGRGPRAPIAITRRVRVPLRAVHLAWATIHHPRAEELVGPIDVVHSIDLAPPPTTRPLVMTTHDVLPLRRPELYERRHIISSRRHASGLARAAAVVATCQATADDVAELTGVPRERIVVAPLGRRLPAATGKRPPIDGPYLLYVGAITPRKGLGTLAIALQRLGSRIPPLLVVGPDGVRAVAVRAQVASLGLGDRLRFLGRVPDDELATLLHHATLLCHPSEAEGFGIPVLEAMGAGTPVIAGDIPSVREIGGDAVVLVPPRDADALAAAIEALVTDPAERTRLQAAGRRRAEPFTWEAMTDRIAELYRQLA